MIRAATVAAAAGIAGLFLGACTGDDGPGAAPDDLAEQVVDATVAAEFAHFRVTLDGDDEPGVTPFLRFEGEVSFASNAARYDVAAVTGIGGGGLPGQANSSSVIVGGRAWERDEDVGAPWEEVPVNFDVLAPWNSGGTRTPVAALRAAFTTGEFETIADDEIDGTPVVHYRSDVDDHVIDLWVDGDLRIRLVTSDAPHPHPSYAAEGIRERWVLEFSALGDPIDPPITAPV